MAFFGKTKVRRPVAEIVAGLVTMVDDLNMSSTEAREEQLSAEESIVALQSERKLLISEQQRAGTICDNLQALLGLDLDGDGEPDDLDKAIASFNEKPVEVDITPNDGDVL
jgi:hypothetical protein